MKYWLLLSLVLNIFTLQLAVSNRSLLITQIDAHSNMAAVMNETIEEIDNGRIEDE